MKKANERLTVLVSSTVYGIEELLERIYVLLTQYGYDVWMSHKGTMPVLPDRSNFENCIDAVDKCDLFLGIITTHYGSGRERRTGMSITHAELLKAIELNKPRWLLAHDQVVFARKLLDKLGFATPVARADLLTMLGFNTVTKRAALEKRQNAVIDDLRVIDMYEAAIRDDIHIRNRKGNWVQEFVSPQDAQLFASAQFYRYQEVEDFIKEHLANRSAVRERVRKEVRP